MCCDLTVCVAQGSTGAGIEWTTRWRDLLTPGVAVSPGFVMRFGLPVRRRWKEGRKETGASGPSSHRTVYYIYDIRR